jgi:hypothetical protein
MTRASSAPASSGGPLILLPLGTALRGGRRLLLLPERVVPCVDSEDVAPERSVYDGELANLSNLSPNVRFEQTLEGCHRRRSLPREDTCMFRASNRMVSLRRVSSSSWRMTDSRTPSPAFGPLSQVSPSRNGAAQWGGQADTGALPAPRVRSRIFIMPPSQSSILPPGSPAN